MPRPLDRLRGRVFDQHQAGRNQETVDRAPVDTVMAYLADMHDAETWAFKAWKEADRRHGSVDAESIKARWRDIRAKYCTSRVIEQPLSVAYGDPPTNDPAKTRVVKVAVSRTDRALVETLERFNDRPVMEARHEYRLHLVGGEWRLNSRVYKKSGEPSIRGLL